MTMDPKLQRVRDRNFEVKVDVHRNQTPTGGGGGGGGFYATGPPTGVGKSGGGASRNLWLSAALENRRLVEEEHKPYWNSLELGHDRKVEGHLRRLVNSYDEQIIVPSRLITYDPLRITEFLNGPSGDDEFGYRVEPLSQHLPKKVKLFETGASFDQTDLEERRTSRTDGGAIELPGGADVRKDSLASRRDSLASYTRRDSLANYPRRDSLTADNTASFIRQKTWGTRTFRGIAMSRTIDIPDRLTRRNAPATSNRHPMQGPTGDQTGATASTTEAMTKDQSTSARRQTYVSAFSSNRSRRSADGTSFDSVSAADVDASESSHCEVTTTSVESSTTTASTDSTGDARSSHKLNQMRDDSGYKSLETQQSLARTGTQSLDVQAVTPGKRISGQSLDSQVHMPTAPRVLVGLARSPEQVKSSMRVVAAARRQEECPPIEGTASERLVPVADECAAPKSRASQIGSKSGSLSMESSPRESLQNKNFLEVPNTERGFRLPLTKARSQDFVGSVQDEGGSGPSTVPSSASSIFPLSLERLWNRAEHYLSSAVIQAESLLGMSGSRDGEPPTSPALGEIQVVPNTEEEATEKVSVLIKPDLGNGSSFPSRGQSADVVEDVRCAEREKELGTGSLTLLTNRPQTYRVSDTVIRPVWSQLIAEKEAQALEEKLARESGGGGVALHTKVGAIRRGDLKTASKKRREYRSRKQLTEVIDSSLEPSSTDRLFGHPCSAAHRDGDPPANTADLRRSLTTRDYSVDEKSYAIFSDFLQYDPKLEGSPGPCQSSMPSVAESCLQIGSSPQQHPVTIRPSWKRTDSVLEAKRSSFQGPSPNTRSLDVEMTVPTTRSTKLNYDRIAEETLPLDGDS